MSLDRVSQVDLQDIGGRDLQPQAVLRCSASRLAREFGVRFEHGRDDFDAFEAVGLSVGQHVPRLASQAVLTAYSTGVLIAEPRVQPLSFMVQRYANEPQDRMTVFLPASLSSGNAIAAAIDRIRLALRLDPDAITWQRRDDPGL